MTVRNKYTFKLLLIIHLFKGHLTANIQTSKKSLNPRCLIPKDEFCGPGYAYVHSANMCQVVSEGACTFPDTLPFKTKEECEAECLVDIQLNTPVTAQKVPESLRIKTKVHLPQKKPLSKPKNIDETTELSENYALLAKKPLSKHKNIDETTEANENDAPSAKSLSKPKHIDETTIANENNAPSAVSISKENSDLTENDYDWYEHKNYMVDNVPRCEQPREVSLCRGFWPRWYFNKSAGECQEFTYGGCGRDDQTTNNFFTQYHCMTVCLEILPCPDDVSKACNVSTTDCANPSCPLHPDAICQVESCTCKATYIDDFGDLVNCIDPTEVPRILEYPWYFWVIGVLSLLLLVLCIICCYKCLRPRRDSYQNFQPDTSLVDTSINEGNFTPRKTFVKPGKLYNS